MFQAGWQDIRIPGFGVQFPNVMRRANLITPLVYLGFVRRSVWQIQTEFGPLLLLGRSGTTGYDEMGPGNIVFPIQRVFPGTFIVEPDHP